MKKISAAAFIILALVLAARGNITLSNLVSDHMVLQREVKVRIWGWANAGEKVTVEFKGQIAVTETKSDGTWSVWLDPMKAGGPYDLIINGNNKIVLRDILIGEVWVASGQSNMEWPVCASANANEEVARANYPQIRLFTVSKQSATNPQTRVWGEWVHCSPKTVPGFSAVAYFFGRDLYKKLNIPIGIINSSWGGTVAETWTPREIIKAYPALKHFEEAIVGSEKDLPNAMKKYQGQLEEWEKTTHRNDPGNIGLGKGWAKPEYVDQDWLPIELPGSFDNLNGKSDFDGVAWFRKEINIPSDWAGKDLELSLGAIDDYDTTYFNGTKVGSIGTETLHPHIAPRNYKISRLLVKAGRNVIAVRAFDNFLDGCFRGPAQDMTIQVAGKKEAGTVCLSGKWMAKIEQEIHPIHPELGKPGEPICSGNVNSPTALYNAMIYPLTPYTIRGAIWYQGEGNSGRGYEYRTLFPAMIQGWRNAWGQGNFPFLFVQLANFMAVKPEPSESGWAELQEAQMLTLKYPNTGMAVAVDIGDAQNIHPTNKQDVGKRLALWALAKTYGMDKLVYSGPLYKSMSVEGNKIRINFEYAEGGLAAKGDKLTGFAIAGKDKKFVWAEAKIEGNSVVVWSDKVSQPVAVRYAWAENPICNLYNQAGLPASSFRTDK